MRKGNYMNAKPKHPQTLTFPASMAMTVLLSSPLVKYYQFTKTKAA